MTIHLAKNAKFSLLAGAVVAALIAVSLSNVSPARAQTADANGVISGSVTIDKGVVQAFRVKAKDTVRGITYTVYTNKGQYHIYNIPASRYDVSVLEETADSPVEHVSLAGGGTATANLALKAKTAEFEGVGVTGARAQENYGGARGIGKDPTAKIVTFDEMYPQGPGRVLLEERCFGCHGPSGWHRRGDHTEAEWGAMVEKMFTPRGAGNMAAPAIAVGSMTDADKQTIIKYLAANFGPGAPSRDLRPDPIVRDEDVLSKTMFVQYDLPPINEEAVKAAGIPRASRGTHDTFPSPSMPGVVWVDGFGSSSILRVDTNNPDPIKRTKEWYISDDRHIGVEPHAINEINGKVYWTELIGDHLGEMDIKTEEMHRYVAPNKYGAGMHTLHVDLDGSNVWYSDFAGGIGQFDTKTKQFTEHNPVPGLNPYSIKVDKQGRIWANGVHKYALVMWEPKTKEWSTFKMPVNLRRISFDSKGDIWGCSYLSNEVVHFDAKTLKVVEEVKLPLKYGNPYATIVDKDDNVWVENAVYNSFVKYDRKSKKWSYFPFPDLSDHTPNMEMDANGVIWFGLGRPAKLTALKVNANVMTRTTASR